MCNVQFCAHQHIPLLDLFGRNTVGENVGVSRGPEENKKTASAIRSCKLYVLAPALKNSQRCMDRARMQQSKRKFLQKSVGERFGVGWPQYGFWLDFSGFLSLQGRLVRPRKIGQIVPSLEILTEILDFYFSILWQPYQPKKWTKTR